MCLTLGELLGFLIFRCGIDIDPAKAKAIPEIPKPCNERALRSSLGRVRAIWHLVDGFTEV
jgi:hypothetical protein